MSNEAMPIPLFVTYDEGGKFVPFAEHRMACGDALRTVGVIGIFFSDGSIVDAYLGWRNGPNPDAHHLHTYMKDGVMHFGKENKMLFEREFK